VIEPNPIALMPATKGVSKLLTPWGLSLFMLGHANPKADQTLQSLPHPNFGCCEFSGVDRLHKNRHNSRSNVSDRHSRISGKNQAP
jgi:hypothetical protein